MRMTMVRHCHSSAVRPSVAGLLGFAAAALLLCSPPARADVTWKATKTGDWLVASNWTGGVPTSGSNADIFNGGTATISRAESCSSLSLGNTAGSGMIELNGGGLTVSNSAFVGLSGAGSFTQSAGSSTVSSTTGGLYVGYNTGASGDYSLVAGQLSGGNEYVAYSGTGNFSQSGGTNNLSHYLYLGYNATASGTYTLSDAGLSASTSSVCEYLGESGTGTFNQSGGTNDTSWMYIGDNAGSSGSYTLSGTGWLFATGEYIGNSGTGSFTQNGGWNNLSSAWFILGGGTAASGTYTLNAGRLYSAEIYVGYGGTGNFIQTGGTNTGAYSIQLGQSVSGTGTYTLNGSGYIFVTNEVVGESGSGTFTQTGGTNSTYQLNVADASSAHGAYTLSSTGQLLTQYEEIGVSGPGAFTQSGGTNTVAKCFYLGYNAGSNATYNLNDGQLSATGTPYYTSPAGEFVGYSGTGTFTQSGGANAVANALYLGYNAGSSGTYNLSGSGLLSAVYEYVGCSGTGNFIQSGGTNSVTYLIIGSDGLYQLNGGVLQINGNFVNSGIFDAGNSSAVLSGSDCILDLSTGTWQNLGAATVSMGPDSLLIVPPGFDTSTGFGSYSSLGLTHTAGTTLVVPAGQGFGGWGSINDPVNCQGSIAAAAGGFINLNNGLVLSGTGTVALGSGTLTVNDTASGISGGSLAASTEYVGSTTAGMFTQSGGTNAVSGTLYLGYNAGSSGTYDLNGGVLVVSAMSGGSGTAAFNFGGGTLQAGGPLSASLPMTLTGSGGNATVDTAGYTVTLSGSLSGPGGLSKTDSGTLVLATTNTFTGSTTVSAGTLQLNNAQAVQNSTVNVNAVGGLSFGTGVGTFTLGGLAGSGSFTLADTGGNAVALQVGNNNANTAYSGSLSGSGSMTKIGGGRCNSTATTLSPARRSSAPAHFPAPAP